QSGLAVWSVLSVIGATSEWLQGYVHRGPSLRDAIANSLGSAAGILALEAWRRRQRPVRVWPIWVAAIVLMLVAEGEPLWIIADVFRQKLAMPLIASFESAGELNRFAPEHARMARAEAHATDGRFSLQVDLEPAQYPGLNMFAPPADWSGYRALACDIYVD